LGAQTSGTRMESLIIVDTDIFIDHFRGKREATEYLESINPLVRATTDINVMELVTGTKNMSELRNVEQFLTNNLFNILPITSKASKLAVNLYKKYRLSNGLSMPDALTASIVLELNATLVSGNIRHFQFIPNLKLQRPPYR
jgi:predicted nucleic acid-binding protein